MRWLNGVTTMVLALTPTQPLHCALYLAAVVVAMTVAIQMTVMVLKKTRMDNLSHIDSYNCMC